MKFNIDSAKQKYDHYNQLYFDGVLPASENIHWELNNRASCLAFVQYPNSIYQKFPKMSLSTAYDFESENDIDHTIIHEMIHIYQWFKDVPDRGHGLYFKAYCQMINDKSNGKFQISRVHKSENKISVVKKTDILFSEL